MRTKLIPNFLIDENPERLAAEVTQALLKNGGGNSRSVGELFRRIRQVGLTRSLPGDSSLNKKSAAFHTLLADCVGAFSSFAIGDLALHQLNFISPVLSALPATGFAADFRLSIQHGETLCSRILYDASDCQQQRLTSVKAEPTESGWRLNGDLPVLLMAPDTRWHLVFAMVENAPNVKVFMLNKEALGMVVTSQAPVSADSGCVLVRATLSNVTLEREMCMGDVSTECIVKLLLESQILESCRLNSRARALLDSIIEFLRARRSADRPLLERDVLQHRLAALDAEWSMSRALNCHSIETHLLGQDVHSLANSCKYLASTLMQNIASAALHLGGITHYRKDSPIAQAYQEVCWNALLVERDERLLADIL